METAALNKSEFFFDVCVSAMQQTLSTLSFQQSASTCILPGNAISFSSLGKSDYLADYHCK